MRHKKNAIPTIYPIPCMVRISPEANLLCFSSIQPNEDGTYTIYCGMEKNKRIYTKRVGMAINWKSEHVPDQFIVKITPGFLEK